MSEEVDALKRTISERDAMIAQLKNKTKEFVNKLKEDNAVATSKLEAEHKANIKTQLDELKAKFKNAHDGLLASHSSEITNLKARHDATIAELKLEVSRLSAGQAATDSNLVEVSLLEKQLVDMKIANEALHDEASKLTAHVKSMEEEKAIFIAESEAKSEARQDEFCKIVLLQQTLQKQDVEKKHKEELAEKGRLLEQKQKEIEVCTERLRALEAGEQAVPASPGATDSLETEIDVLRKENAELKSQLAAVEAGSGPKDGVVAEQPVPSGSADAEAQSVAELIAQLGECREARALDTEELRAELKCKENELCCTVEQLSASVSACDDLRRRCEDLEAVIAASEQKTARAEEEKRGIQATSVDTIDRLLVETQALRQQVDHLTLVGQGAELEEEKLSKELDGLTDTNVALTGELEQVKASCAGLTKKRDKAQTDLASRDKELAAANAELAALKVEHASAVQQIDTLKLLVSDAETQVSFAESAKQSVEVQRSDILKAKGELQSQVLLKDETIAQLRKELDDIAKKNQYLLEEKLNETHVSSTAVITDLNDMITEKTEMVELLNRKLDSCLELEKSYVQQIEASAETIKQLEQQIAAELQQNQERKVKFKSYVDKLTSEKQSLDFKCTSTEKQLKEFEEKCTAFEAEATRLKLLSEQQVEKFTSELAQQEKLVDELRSALHTAEEQNRSITEDIRTKYDEDMKSYATQASGMKIELEELSQKRTTARSELIKMAQSMERAQKEGMEVKALFQFTFLPMLQEQVGSIQSILVLLESSTNQLLKKSSASLQARLKAKAKGAARGPGARRRPSIGTPDDADVDGSDADTNDEDSSGAPTGARQVPASPQAHLSLLQDSSPLHKGGGGLGRLGIAKRLNVPSINTSGAGVSAGSNNPMPVLLEYADSCRSSLDMLAGGITLVSSSVEKLHDIVQLDSTTSCAETMGNLISGVMVAFAPQAPSIASARGINRREYSTIELENSTSL